ncbi:CPBP family intramembrane metalloprotease [Robertkochia marina]|uniref:CPBP family intramembrane metalloprotease n=1 Tax=Robertkochia marina TaxID=1227945 RepID=A0A4S3M4R9_9FLAO|nr:CPBP family intramembrane glutamic endopeptidase [Robertkochia marina]THD69845.1 CPBP family intramembrane metalloprotease [Robertkochia marina]TRZ46810.1 CPBP family intramembrane metalloprotease [Robertkochia marina]
MNNLIHHISLCTVVFLAFLLFSLQAAGKQEKRLSQQLKLGTISGKLIQMQIMGTCILAFSLVIPTPYLSLPSLLKQPHFSGYLTSTYLVLILMTTGLGIFSARKVLEEQTFKQILPDYYNAFTYLISRIIYLTVYELFFRGVLFLGVLLFTNALVAVLINLILYFLIHIRDSKAELIGTIPFGLVLCYTTFHSQSVWPAICLHLLLSLSHEGFLLYHLILKPIKK